MTELATPLLEYRRGESPAATLDLPDGWAAVLAMDPPFGLDPVHGYGRNEIRIQGDEDLGELERVAPEGLRLLRENGVLLCCMAPTVVGAAQNVLKRAGFDLHGVICWDLLLPGIRYTARWEWEAMIVASHRGYSPWEETVLRNPECREPLRTFYRQRRLIHKLHPHEKPVRLWKTYIGWALKGRYRGPVVDHFAGVASSGTAAKILGVPWIGVEKDERWWPDAERRLAILEDRAHPLEPQASLFTAKTP